MPGSLVALKNIGVQSIELCSPLDYEDFASLSDGKQVRKFIADHGLTCESAHFGMDELRKRQSESIAWAHDVGITQMVTATLGAGDKPDARRREAGGRRIQQDCRRVPRARAFSRGCTTRDSRCRRSAAQRTYDILFELLDPVAREVPVPDVDDRPRLRRGRLLHEVSGPVQLDARAGRGSEREAPVARAATMTTRGVARRCPVGKGSIDWVKTFQAAKTGGVKSYFVEQNMEFTKQSVAFLKNLQV